MSLLEIQVYANKWFKNIGIVMKFGKNVYFVNLNHITKFCYGRPISTSRSKLLPLGKYV